MTLSSGSNFCYHPCISCQQSIINNPSSMQPTTSNMSYLYTILAQETGYVLLISPGLWLPLSRIVEKARWLQLEKFKSGCRSKSSRTVQTLPMLTLWCLTLFHKLLYQLPARCNGISLLWPHQVLEHLLYLLYHQSIWFFFMKSLFLITSFKRSSTSQATATTMPFLGFPYMCSLKRLMSQPHFGLSVKVKLTLPKVGTWSPPGLPKIQSSSWRAKTPCIGVFLVSLERSWSVNV